MGDDASLDEFLGDEDGESATETEPDDDESVSESERGDEHSADSVEPARTTYEFAPGGAKCGACGASVDRRWHQDGDLVCAACKDW